MSTRQARTADKSTNDKHTRILKALLQKPGNKFCVDCRKKDPRWASFNLGVFMCIRCSGVHRSMGTHISKGTNLALALFIVMLIFHVQLSKTCDNQPNDSFANRYSTAYTVKSVDLDSWTAEQVENMIKWGNEKANKYWEARLPESSIPNENTSGIDPWIRSKYEWKQFANKGSLPDPSELGPIDEAMLMDLYGKAESNRSHVQMNRSSESSGAFTGMIAPPPSNPTRSTFPKKPTSTGVQGADLFSIGQKPTTHQQQPKPVQDLFGLDDPSPSPSAVKQAAPVSSPTPAPAPAQTSATQDLFSLVAPANSNGQASSQQAAPAKAAANTDWKNSIMSLYGNQSATPKRDSNGFNMGFGQQPPQPQQQQAFGQLQGMNSFGFGQAPQQQQQQQQQQNVWGNDDAFGAMQQAGSASSFDAFASGGNVFGGHNSNNNGFGQTQNGFGQMQNGFGQFNNGFGQQSSTNNNFNSNSNNNNNNNNNGVPQGGDFFNMIAGAARPAVASPPALNKNNSAFGDLTWN
ncbi:hypothetical protein BGZ94_008070 [Podila epigama]|nr:hypothetical protein BGZ94_008070 [Podila epigama]